MVQVVVDSSVMHLSVEYEQVQTELMVPMDPMGQKALTAVTRIEYDLQSVFVCEAPLGQLRPEPMEL